MGAQVDLQTLEDNCELVTEVMKVLSHPQRLRLVCFLAEGPGKNVSELQALCGISQSHLSQFLRLLKLQGIVSSERQGNFVTYSICDKRIVSLVRALQRIYCPS